MVRPSTPETAALRQEISRLRDRLEETEATLEAIRRGDVDAVLVEGPAGPRLYSLEGAEHVYRTVVESMHEAALTLDTGGIVHFANQRAAELLRLPLNQLLGTSLHRFAAPPQARVLGALLAAALERPLQRTLTLKADDGTPVPVQIAASRLEDEGGASLCLVISDLTALEAATHSLRLLRERQEALEASQYALREQEERLRLALEASGMGTFDWDVRSGHLTGSPRQEALWGFAPGGFDGRYESFDARLHPEDRAKVAAELARCRANRDRFSAEYRIVWPDGGVHWMRGRGEFVYGPDGVPVRMRGTCVEITDSKRKSLELEEHERLLAESQHIARIGSWHWPLGGEQPVRWRAWVPPESRPAASFPRQSATIPALPNAEPWGCLSRGGGFPAVRREASATLSHQRGCATCSRLYSAVSRH